jgi:hypothetical protein
MNIIREINKPLNEDQYAKDYYNIDNRLTLAKMHLDEQIIKQIRRNFYHISPEKVDQLEPNSFYCNIQHKYGVIFLSNSVKFCQDFFKAARSNFGFIAYLYTCKLKTLIPNLFNMDYQKDWFRCEKFISNNKKEEFENLFDKFYKKQYKERWFDFEQSILPDLIYEAGFLGYSNFGILLQDDFHGANNMAIYEKFSIDIIDIKEIDIYENYEEDKFNLLKEEIK